MIVKLLDQYKLRMLANELRMHYRHSGPALLGRLNGQAVRIDIERKKYKTSLRIQTDSMLGAGRIRILNKAMKRYSLFSRLAYNSSYMNQRRGKDHICVFTNDIPTGYIEELYSVLPWSIPFSLWVNPRFSTLLLPVNTDLGRAKKAVRSLVSISEQPVNIHEISEVWAQVD